ncbi:hypothetical protein DYB32_005055 [Aphanomyces invadans]|uniref:Zinc finger PHD-type domain-containing protein n=1 Tax=Aphanomyces invadans TaxID=157072 RepID=A0A418AVK0_9STRA|nr:hypothetical protein DYB32_005055 [Aphanomyces invadans]
MIPFIYERNFLVMTNDGLRHKRLEGMCKEPRVTTRPKGKHPMLKIVDMISCTSIHDRNETCTLVRVRWQNLDWTNDTWVLTNQVENTALLQQFYVGASSSWQTSQFISKMARYRYPSEEQLWDDEPGIADWKREHRITGLTKPSESENSASFSSATHPRLRALPPSSGSSRPVDHHPLDDSHPSSRRPNAPSEQYSFHYARFGTSKKHSPTATEIATDAAKLSSAATQAAKQAFAQDSLATSQPARPVVEVSEARHQNGDGRRGNDSTNLSHDRRDDAPWEVKEPRSKRIRAASPLSSEAASTDKAEAAHAAPRHFVHDRLAVLADRRLKRQKASQHPLKSQPESKHHDSIEPESTNVDAAPRVSGASHTQVEPTPAPAAATPAVKMHAEPMHPMWRPPTLPRSVIRCLCGATSVEDYIGEWVQCWTESCGSWFHVTCVPTPLTTPYRCASCCSVSRPTFPPVPTPHLLYLCCKANSRRAFRAAIDNFPSKPSFLRYKCLADDNSNGVVVAAKVGAKAILEEFLALFTPSQVTSSVNILNQTPLHVPDAYSSLPIDYVLQVQPAQVIPLLQDQPELVDVVNSATGNSIAHALCASAPPNFASILALLPPSLLASVNHHGQTPAMMLLRAPNVSRSHFQALVQFSTNASTSNSWWTHVDDQGRTVVHFALTYKHQWALELVDLAAFREFKLLHMAAELGLAQAVALLVSAQFSLRTQHGGDTEPSLTSTGWWPILHASTPSCVLELLRTDTIAQLEYLYQHSQTHSSKVYQILNSIASHLPLYDFVQTIALASPDQYLTGRCQFLQRFRKCLRLDVKLLQLQLHVASIPAVQTSAMSVYAPSEDELWTCIQAQCPTTMNWRRPFELTIQTTVWPSRHPHVWDLLASQLRRLGSHLFDAPSSVFGLLGRLLAHMVVVGQKLSSAVLPPPFLSTPAEFKPDLATAFKAGFDSVLPGVVDNWNGYERFILLHKVEFPQTLQQWKNGLVTYDAPFHPRHPSIVSFWNVIESGLVPHEQVVCRLRCGQPLRITPAPTVGIVEKTVFGVPETIPFEKLHVDLVLYIRGFRKQVRKRLPS